MVGLGRSILAQTINGSEDKAHKYLIAEDAAMFLREDDIEVGFREEIIEISEKLGEAIANGGLLDICTESIDEESDEKSPPLKKRKTQRKIESFFD